MNQLGSFHSLVLGHTLLEQTTLLSFITALPIHTCTWVRPNLIEGTTFFFSVHVHILRTLN